MSKEILLITSFYPARQALDEPLPRANLIRHTKSLDTPARAMTALIYGWLR